nr:phage tail length tape measure family protein [Brevundimonas diminuta]
MSVKQVAIRLKPEGGRDVIREAEGAERALVRMNERAAAGSDKAAAAAMREVERLREVANAAAHANTAMQARIDQTTGVSGGTNARAATAARTFMAAEEAYDRRARVLLETLNPLWAAQQKLNQELAEYDALAKRGKISTEQMAQAQTLARQRFNETTAALERQGKGLSRNVMASRLNLTRQGADVFTTAAMGMNPAMIAIQQGPQILDAWSTSAIKLTGPLTLLVGSVGLLAGATAAMAVAWTQGQGSALAYERAASGLGRTAQMTAGELKAAAEAGAEAGEISLRSAREMATAYISTGKIGGEVMSGLIAITKDYAEFAGTDAKGATEMLAKSFAEPEKAAREMTRQFGLLDQKTLEHIDSLAKLGDRTAAQKLLLEALTGAVDGHADRVTTVSSAWDAAARAVSNYWSKLGEALYTTPEERIGKLEDALQNRPLLLPGARRGLERQLDDLRFQQGYDNAKQENDRRLAAANQAAQEAKDRADAGKKDRDKGARDAERARREAERQARELLQRARREEDVGANLSLQEAKATNDLDRVRALESEARVRARIRQLEDDSVGAAEARNRATQEEKRLQDAMAMQRDEEGLKLQREAEAQVMRLLGEERSLENQRQRIDHEDRILAYQKAGYDLVTATNMAEADRNRLVEARSVALKRAIADAKTEHRLNLMRLSGDEDGYRQLSIDDRIKRRAREIEQRNKLNPGEGDKQARKEIKEELDATALGARRAWMRDMLSDIRSGGIGDALAGQLERATDKWADKLADMLAGLDWGGALKAMFGGGGGMSGALGALFSGGEGHAAGTDFSPGGWKWVGERGPELLNLPRGSRVLEHNRALHAAAGGGAMNVSLGGLTIKNYGSEPMTGRLSQSPGGGLELELEPLFKSQLAKAGKDGSLARAQRATPQPRRRG